MSDVGVTLIWCGAQVAALGAVAAILFRISRSLAPTAAPLVCFCSLVLVILLVGASFGPVPSYFDWVDVPQMLEQTFALNRSAEEAPPQVAGGSAARSATVILGDMARAMLRELSRVRSHALISDWPWAGVVSLLFLFGLGVGLLQLGMGLAAVQAYRRRSHPVRDRRLLALLRSVAAEMGCRRQVEVGVSYDLSTAATVGWLRPLILLPPDWRNWSDTEKRAVLAHELAHIHHQDYLAVVLAQISVALHFYHPVVHWLVRRLRLEQEFAADAAAAPVVGGRRAYLTSLASLALRREDQPTPWLSRAFLPDSGSLLDRVRMLREQRPRPAHLSSGAYVLMVASVALAGVLVAGIRGPRGAHAAAPAPAIEAADSSRTAVATALTGTPQLCAMHEDARDGQIRRQLRRLSAALRKYHEEKGHFPPARMLGPDGKTVHSWRVALLPYLGRSDLYRRYRRREPWNSPHNLRVAQRMPNVYRDPRLPPGTTRTCFSAVLGRRTAFGRQAVRRGRSLTDLQRPARTVLVVASRRPRRWTQPRDLRAETVGLSRNGGRDLRRQLPAAWCDGGIRTVLPAVGGTRRSGYSLAGTFR